MNREIKFRVWDNVDYRSTPFTLQDLQDKTIQFTNDCKVLQYTGLKDKNGKEIYEGDIVRYYTTYRTTQTHTGDNIPNGSYTEPMEPGIKCTEGEVIFKDGMFQLDNVDGPSFGDGMETPLQWHIFEPTLEDIKESIRTDKDSKDIFDWFNDPEEGDLPYLITEVAKVKDEAELLEMLRGIEVIGDIYQNPDLL
jgi:hypothetical protein